MNNFEKTLNHCLIDLYHRDAKLVALPGYYESKHSCGYAVETRSYCCMLNPHIRREQSLLMSGYMDHKNFINRRVSYEQYKLVQEFCGYLKDPEILPIFRNNDLTWDLLDQVGLKKRITKNRNLLNRDWVATILENSIVFELQGSPVREVFCIKNNPDTEYVDIWHENKSYDTQWIRGCFQSIVEAYTEDSERTRSWIDAWKK